jgi:hypothetical protein
MFNLTVPEAGRWLASADDQPQPLQVVQDEPGDHPPGGDALRPVSTFALKRRGLGSHERRIDVGQETFRMCIRQRSWTLDKESMDLIQATGIWAITWGNSSQENGQNPRKLRCVSGGLGW